jgi:uncharacterized protein (DUF58 family)
MLRALSELFSFRDLRNALVGTVVVIGGLALAGVTLYAHQTGNIKLAGISAGASLVFVLIILVFIVPPLARNAGREASQLNLPFEFTTGGAIMLVLVLIVAFSAWNTGNNLLFIVLSFLIASLVVGFLAGHVCLKKLDIKMRFPDTIFAGEATPIIVSLTNRKRVFPSFSVVAEVRGKERELSIMSDELDALLPAWIAKRLGRAPIVRRILDHFAYIGRSSTCELRSEHIFPHRGRLMIRDFELSTKFPFGFFRHRRRLSAKSAEIVILPRAEHLDLRLTDIPSGSGELSTARRGPGLDLLALRDYQPQDELRSIDWKATARSRTLTVREYANEDELKVSVFLDPRVTRNPKNEARLRERLAAEQAGKPVVASERFEAGASLAAAVLSHLAAENADFRLIVEGSAGEFGRGRGHLYDSLKRLATAEPDILTGPDTPEPDADLSRMLSQTEEGHRILLTARGAGDLPPEVIQTLKIIEF